MTSLATPAWWMAGGLRNVPGVLAAGKGRLAFVTDDGPVFAVPLDRVDDVRWPWHWFGGGCVLGIDGTRYKITFVRPNGAEPVRPSLLEAAQPLVEALLLGGVTGHSLAGLFDVRSGRRAGAAWKEALPR